MRKDTEKMNRELELVKNEADLDRFLKENNGVIKETFSDWLYEKMEEKGMKAAEVYKNCAISQAFYYGILNGTKKPSKEMIIKIGIALGLSVEELNTGIKTGGFKELYPKNKDDAIIIFGMKNKKSVGEIDQMLRDRGCSMILIDKDDVKK